MTICSIKKRKTFSNELYFPSGSYICSRNNNKYACIALHLLSANCLSALLEKSRKLCSGLWYRITTGHRKCVQSAFIILWWQDSCINMIKRSLFCIIGGIRLFQNNCSSPSLTCKLLRIINSLKRRNISKMSIGNCSIKKVVSYSAVTSCYFFTPFPPVPCVPLK
jgi:hypothetical protein